MTSTASAAGASVSTAVASSGAGGGGISGWSRLGANFYGYAPAYGCREAAARLSHTARSGDRPIPGRACAPKLRAGLERRWSDGQHSDCGRRIERKRPRGRAGAHLAAATGAAVTFVFVRQPPIPLLGAPYYQRSLTSELEHAEEALGRALDARSRDAGVSAFARLFEGEAAQVIVELARQP